MKTIKAIHITAKRWFQKLYGNTYHTVKIEVVFDDDTREILTHDRTYGYGEMWNQTALNMLIKAGYAAQEYYPVPHEKQPKYSYATTYCRDKNILCFTSVTDVTRQRDL
jgi:hypothetical protein